MTEDADAYLRHLAFTVRGLLALDDGDTEKALVMLRGSIVPATTLDLRVAGPLTELHDRLRGDGCDDRHEAMRAFSTWLQSAIPAYILASAPGEYRADVVPRRHFVAD